MGSDTFAVRLIRLERSAVVFDLLPDPSGGFEDCFSSRSFAFLILHDALREASHTARNRRVRERLEKKHELSALTKLMKGEDADWRTSPAWMQANVGRFVLRTEVVARKNELGEEELRRREAAITERMGGVLSLARRDEWQPMRWKKLFHYRLRVVATEPKWLAHLEKGLEFGTGAYEVWKEAEADAPTSGQRPQRGKTTRTSSPDSAH